MRTYRRTYLGCEGLPSLCHRLALPDYLYLDIDTREPAVRRSVDDVFDIIGDVTKWRRARTCPWLRTSLAKQYTSRSTPFFADRNKQQDVHILVSSRSWRNFSTAEGIFV